MTSSLTHEVQRGEGETKIALVGEITEEADFTPLLGLRSQRLLIDLSRITRINSSGLREWIDFVRTTNQQGARITLERCPPLIVNQLNMIWRFAGDGGEVRSVFAPYYCKRCDVEHLELIDFSSQPIELPPASIPCPKCKQPTEFDDIREIYLQFRTTMD